MGGPRRNHMGTDQPREPGHTNHHPQLGDLPEPDRDLHIGLPQIELSQLARAIPSPLRRIRQHKQRPQLANPIPQHRHPPLPTDPFRDHRRGHLRAPRQQLPDLRLDRINNRTPPGSLILRRRIRTNRCPHRVTSYPQPAGNRLDPQLLSPVQPTNLGPILHVDQSPILPADIQPGSSIEHYQWRTRPAGGQNSGGDKGSVFTRWRHRERLLSRIAPRIATNGRSADRRRTPDHAETPALAGVSVARPEGLEPPTFCSSVVNRQPSRFIARPTLSTLGVYQYHWGRWFPPGLAASGQEMPAAPAVYLSARALPAQRALDHASTDANGTHAYRNGNRRPVPRCVSTVSTESDPVGKGRRSTELTWGTCKRASDQGFRVFTMPHCLALLCSG